MWFYNPIFVPLNLTSFLTQSHVVTVKFRSKRFKTNQIACITCILARCNYMYVSHLEIASSDVRRDMSTKSSRKTYLQQVINRSRTKDGSFNSEIK